MTDVTDDVRDLERTEIVATSNGPVRGYRDGGLQIFKGLRYAAPPLGALRFAPPRKPAPWTQPADAVALAAPAIQVGVPPGETTGGRSAGDPPAPGQPGTDEDCLFINVWTPGLAGQRPVMVWLHGGGFTMGSAGDRQYDGSALCRRGDVVVVTLNHRLGALGYLYLGGLDPGLADSGNVGQLDIVLALQWVRDNISAFGGDPANVTLFGESGGGHKLSILLAMPAAKGLFHRAIVQSGPVVTTIDATGATALAERTLAGLGLSKADVHKLQDIDAATLIKAASAAEQPRARQTLAPVVDGRSLPVQPFSPTAPAISRDIPLIIGTNKDEGTLFLSADPVFGTMTEDQARAHFTAMLGPRGEPALQVYKQMRPHDPPTYWVTALMTDLMMRVDSIRLAERKAGQGGAPVFMYRLDWETPVLGGALRSPHGVDVPLVFDTVETKRSILGDGPEPQRLADLLSQAWINFARGGDPSQPGLSWPAYDAATRRTLIFDTRSRVESDPDAAGRRFWGT